ncbi:MAG: hypothetical protein RLZZ387_2506 [Chloroflexota bacterium]|jgi:hypothetical protein
MDDTMNGLDLGRYQWRNRLLLLFAPAADDPLFVVQQDELAAHRSGLAERGLLVFVLFATADGEGDSQVVSPAQAADLRTRFGVSTNSLTVLLIGKDGTEKLRSGRVVPAADLFGLIDSMPMRRDEMRGAGTASRDRQ